MNQATTRNYAPILQIVTEDGFPRNVQYHSTCRSLFTMKRDLDKISKSTTNSESRKSCRLSNVTAEKNTCGILERKCLFCKKVTKYERSTNTKERLYTITEFRACESIKLASKLHKDEMLMALSTEDLIAKEAVYHRSCYRDYTKIIYSSQKSELNQDSCIDPMDQAFSEVKEYISCLRENPAVIENTVLTNILEANLAQLDNFDKNTIICAKKNLRRRIETNMPGIHFLNYSPQKVLVYPDTLSIADLVRENFELKEELEAFKKTSNDQHAILQASQIIRNEIKEMKDEMPWPPEAKDLTNDRIRMPKSLDMFINTLLSGSFRQSSSSRVTRIKLSIGEYVKLIILQPLSGTNLG